MDKKQFEELLSSVRWMGKHLRGEKVPARVFEFPEPDVKAIRLAARPRVVVIASFKRSCLCAARF